VPEQVGEKRLATREKRRMSETDPMKDEEVKRIVREGYARVAEMESSCCGPGSSCCGGSALAEDISRKIGYSDEDMQTVPEGANLGLGCGNPVALATIEEGETVVDLGSGAGFDAFLAAQRVGEGGRVIGVDMTPEMIEKARANAAKAGYLNVEFRLGEIEHLPVADTSVDAIISNCVINLAPDKRAVFNDAFRVLKPGGRIMVSDVVLTSELPEQVRESADALVGCVAGAIMKEEYLDAIRDARFERIEVADEKAFSIGLEANDQTCCTVGEAVDISPEAAQEAAGSVRSISVCAYKPKKD